MWRRIASDLSSPAQASQHRASLPSARTRLRQWWLPTLLAAALGGGLATRLSSYTYRKAAPTAVSEGLVGARALPATTPIAAGSPVQPQAVAPTSPGPHLSGASRRSSSLALRLPIRRLARTSISELSAVAVETQAVPAPSQCRQEEDLIEQARDRLRHQDPAAAYAIVQTHGHLFPAGALGEERDLIAIRSLLLLGRKRQAVERLLQFHREHENSLLIPAVDALAPPISEP